MKLVDDDRLEAFLYGCLEGGIVDAAQHSVEELVVGSFLFFMQVGVEQLLAGAGYHGKRPFDAGERGKGFTKNVLEARSV